MKDNLIATESMQHYIMQRYIMQCYIMQCYIMSHSHGLTLNLFKIEYQIAFDIHLS